MAHKINGSGISRYAGTDQGVDFTSSGLIPALARAVVTDVGPETDIEGQHGSYVIYKILQGARKGQFVYTAENFAPTVKVGDVLRPGQTIGVNHGITPGGTGIEIGFNNSPSGWNPVAPLGQGAAAHGPTSAGQQMWDYIQAVEKGLPGPSGSSIPLIPDGNSGGGNVGGASGALPKTGSAHDQALALAQFVLSNTANRQSFVPQVNPLVVNPALPKPIFPMSPINSQHVLGGGVL